MSSAITTSLLNLYTDVPLVAEVIGAEATATTYVLNCAPSVDGNECGTFDNTITLGPWASETLPSGAAETGAYDLFITDSIDPWRFSIHCEMSRTVAQQCTTINIGGNDDGSPTATFSSPEEIEDAGFGDFAYATVVITAGQELLASATAGATSATSDGAASDATGTAKASGTETGSAGTSSSAAGPEKTSGAASPLARVLAALSVAGIATILAHW